MSELVRARPLTTKGKLYMINTQREEKTRVQKRIKTEIAKLSKRIQSEESFDLGEISNAAESLQNLYQEFMLIHGKLSILMDDDEELKAEEVIAEVIDREYTDFRKRYNELLSTQLPDLENGSKASKSIKSHKSGRYSSGKSSRATSRSSRISETILQEKARIAELAVEQKYLEQRMEGQKQEQQFRNASEQMKIECERAKAMAKLKIYEAEVEEESTADAVLRQLPKINKEVYTENFIENSRPVTASELQSQDKNDLLQFIKCMQAPSVDIDIFKGDPTEFLYFMTAFRQNVEEKITDPKARLARLIKYTSGDANELVKSCVYLPTCECYERAKELLRKRYGDPFVISSEYRKHLLSWPKLKANDAASFRKFEGYLHKFQSAMTSVTKASSSNPELLQILVSKLPSYLQDRWNRKVHKVRRDSKNDATLNDFIELISEEIDIISDPLFSREAVMEFNKGSSHELGNKKIKLHQTSTKEVCNCCNKTKHDLEKCHKFMSMNLAGRKKFIFRQKLCFCCFEPTSDSHSARTCQKKRICDVCKEEHPTSLHFFVPHQSGVGRVTTGCITSKAVETVSLSIVPVTIHHKSNPAKCLKTWALLDNGSQGTFVHQSLLDELHAPSTKTSLQIETVSGTVQEQCLAVNDLVVRPIQQLSNSSSVTLPKSYSQDSLPVDVRDIPTKETLQRWKYLEKICKYFPSINNNSFVGLLIGADCPKALEPMEVIQSSGDGPFAYRSRLGWCISGPIHVKQNQQSNVMCNRISVQRADDGSLANHYFSVKDRIKDMSIKEMLVAVYSLDFQESSNEHQLVSIDDRRFLEIMKEATLKDGHYYLPLPIKNPEKVVPNNRQQSLQRAFWLKQRLLKNEKMLSDYTAFMNNMLSNGFAKVAEREPTPNRTWYIPHHGIYHPHKPDKIRVVFDCSATFQKYCLNQEILQGPDLTNQLIGVLLRFRQEPVAVIADVESMFYQVRVPAEFHDYLRFLWWPNGDMSKPLIDHQICVHLFGGASSPSCANFALHKTAGDNKDKFGAEAADILHRNFYVDDLLKSFISAKAAIAVIPNVIQMCKAGGFHLTKFHSNNRDFLSTIPETERSKSLLDLDLLCDPLPIERVLGMRWHPERDIFGFKIKIKDAPSTRRGMLSSLSSIYDPLGIASPYLLQGKQLLQQICSEKCRWDDPLSPTQNAVWEKWKADVIILEQLQIDRCFKSADFGPVKEITLHHFSDASSEGYGQVTYIRLVNDKGQVRCRLVIAKSRVAPLKQQTVPRLELTAAVVSVKVAIFLRKELDLLIAEEFFWTDSQVVLSYIFNESKRFHVYVANRVQFIRENSQLKQWKYVPSKENPADDASRGLSLLNSVKSQRWTRGPEFLYFAEPRWPEQPIVSSVSQSDAEVKKVKLQFVSKRQAGVLDHLEKQISSWYKMKRIIAIMLLWKDIPKRRSVNITVELLQKAERVLIKLIQLKSFPQEILTLQSQNNQLKKCSAIIRLSPIMDVNGIIRVGGRIENSVASFEVKHPIILPRRSISTELIVYDIHQGLHHAGRNATLCRLREKGFWVVNGNSLVRNILHKCVTCRIIRGKFEVQKMADLPPDRLEPSPPFTYCGVDLFGPFFIKERRSELKRYGVIFTCLSSRATHFDCVSSMSTDSFILCLRRFIGRRGPVRIIRCDNGTNFVGTRNEMQKAASEMDEERISNFLLSLGADFISWKHNTPHASNFGGVWERLIRSARNTLHALMKTHGHSLNEESFRTLLVEVEAIINSRPLSVECINDPTSPTPLSPSNLLTMKSDVILPPPGRFQRADLYCRKRWRRVQHISNEFWSRWRKEYLNQLQLRSKWLSNKRNLRTGDIVLVKDDNLKRNEWKLAIVDTIHTSSDKKVRTVTVRQGRSTYSRPINKLVLILENGFPDEEPTD